MRTHKGYCSAAVHIKLGLTGGPSGREWSVKQGVMGERAAACTVAAGAVHAALPRQRHCVLLRAALLHKGGVLRKERLHGQAVAVTDLHGNTDLSVAASPTPWKSKFSGPSLNMLHAAQLWNSEEYMFLSMKRLCGRRVLLRQGAGL